MNAPTTPLLRVENLTKQFNGFTAVDSVSLDIHQGDIHALIGPNGAGKTTFFNLLTRFLRPSSGRIFYKGQDITNLSAAAIARLGLVRSFQISATFPSLTLRENIVVALQRADGRSMWFWRSDQMLSRYCERAEALLEEVDLLPLSALQAHELAYGQKRALELATTLATNPDVLLLDEPTQGMGHEDMDGVVNLIRKAAKSRTVVMVEHNMRVVSGLCNRITVLQRGAVIADGRYAQVSSDPRVIEAYMGSEAGQKDVQHEPA